MNQLIRSNIIKRFQSTKSLRLLNCNSQYTELEFNNGEFSIKYSNLFLKDSSTSQRAMDQHSRQKLFSTPDLINNCQPVSVPRVIDNNLQINWSIDDTLTYSYEFLKSFATREGRRQDKFFENKRQLWDNSIISQIDLQIDYNDYMNNDEVFYRSLKLLSQYGLVFINDIPHEEGQVCHIAQRIGYIRETFYGKLFNVQSKPEAKNIAYTNLQLPLHMDLLYYESPPGLQLLHLLDNSTEGGENIFADSIFAANSISELDPSAYLALKSVDIPYHYHNDNEYYYYQRPLIVEDEKFINLNGKQFISQVNYSPPFQAPFENHEIIEFNSINSGICKDFLRGLDFFEKIINSPRQQFQIKLPENTCVIFDNRRILHSRRSFKFANNTQCRWLQGCYIDSDTFMSRLRIYYEKFQ